MTDLYNNAAAESQPPNDVSTAIATLPPRYHQALLHYLKTQEPELWTWFSSQKALDETSETVRLELLKSAYRMDRESETDIYAMADQAAQMMNLTATVTLYQAQQAVGLNASLAWLPDEAHIVLHGPIRETLQAEELQALLVHELAHHELLTISNGDYLAMEHILMAMVADQSADSPHERTWRSHRLWTELFCDRRAVDITGNPEACVCALVKMETGLKDVSASAYLHQADEVLANQLANQKQPTTGSEGLTHPEMFIRAKAVQLWHEDPSTADDTIRVMIDGRLQLKTLDIMQQREVQLLTETFVRTFLQPEWLQTDLVIGHAHRFLDTKGVVEKSSVRKLLVSPPQQQQSEPANDDVPEELPDDLHGKLILPLQNCDAELKNFFGYVLLDFVTCDPDLEEYPLAAAFRFSEAVGLLDEFRALVATELKLGKRALQKAEDNAEQMVRNAEQEFAK